jgi:base plate protein
MAALTEFELLTVWESGLGQPPVHRALTLAAAASGADVAELAELSVGRRDALLLALRQRCFGRRLPCVVGCPSCAERLELSLGVDDVRVEPPAADSAQVEVAGVRVTFRPPNSRDLLDLELDLDLNLELDLTVDAGPAVPDARRRLVANCVVDARTADGPVPADDLDDDVLDAVAERMGEADPQADVLLMLTCSSCGHDWGAPFDVAGYLWDEVDAYARRLLHDVHTLATAYGWSEAEALSVSPARRRFYLEAAGS